MRHRVKSSALNRDTNHRKALLKNLVSSLIEVGEIKTTEAKAKVIKPLADKLIYRAQTGTVAVRRLLGRFFGKRSTVNKLVDEVAPAMKDRSSGFTRITPIGTRRGDNAKMVKVELVNRPAVKAVEAIESVAEKKVDQKVTKK